MTQLRLMTPRVAAAMAVLALVALLFVQTRFVDPMAHSRTVGNLSKLQALNAELDDTVLKVRNGLINNYDPLVATLGMIARYKLDLERGPYAIAGRGDAEIDVALDVYARELAAKEALIEQFKTSNALLRNSLLYLPLGVGRLARDPRVPPPVRAHVEAVLRDILLLQLGTLHARPGANSEQIALTVAELRRDEERLPVDVRPAFAATLHHAERALMHGREQDRLVQEITASDVREANRWLVEAYDARFERRLARANLYRFFLLLLSAGLVAYAVYSFLRVRRTAIELNIALAAQALEIAERKQAESALRRSEERLRTIADNVPVLIGYVDNEERYRFVNQTYERWFGEPEERYLGRTLREVLGDERYELLKPGFDKVRAGEVVSEERRTRSRECEQYARFTYLPHRDAGGQVVGFYILAYDTTESKKAAEALAQERNLLLAIVDSLPDHVFVKDLDRRYVLVNAVGRALSGLASNDDAVGKTAFDFFPPQQAAELEDEDKAVMSGSKPFINHERSVVDADGARKWKLTTKVALRGPGGDIAGVIGITRDITERKLAEQTMQVSEERYRKLFECNPQPMWVYCPDTLRFRAVNDAAIEHYGYTRDEFLAMTIRDIRPAEDVSVMVEGVAASRGQLLNRAPRRHKKKDGTVIDVEVTSHELDFFGSPARLAIVNDISEKRRAEQQLHLAASALENAGEGVMITTGERQILFVNKAFTRITGYARSEAVGRDAVFLRAGEPDAVYDAIWQSVCTTGAWQGEIRRRRKNGEIYPERRSVSVVKDERGNPTHYVTVFSDITEFKQDKERLEFLANHDALTRLPNRRLFEDRLGEALHRAHRYRKVASVIFIDLDHFKTINDSLGHGVGDMLLQAVTGRLKGCVRETDTVARLGGDEFAILVEELVESQNAAKVAANVLAALAQPFSLAGHELFISGSIGISSYPDDGRDPQTLLKNADAAMYRAKESGRNTYQFFSVEMNAHALQLLVMTNSLRVALERQEFFLNYQPIVHLATGRVRAVEALVRWNHPELGLVPPARFIPLAEESGLIIPIGEWVLKHACMQMKAWQSRGIAPDRMAVNLSARQFRYKGLAQRVAAILEETRLPPQHLELEITESMVMQDPAEAQNILHQLHNMGIHLAMDDFGTGYSSLSYLKRFPIDFLKIDRSFVRDIPGDADDVAIARAIIALAKGLGLAVVAEGVETEQQRAFLEAEGCDEGQGFLLSKPCAAEALESLLLERARRLRLVEGAGQ